MARKIGGAVRSKQNYSNLPKIKFVKKAGQFVKSYVEVNNRGEEIFKQKWALTREELLD